MLTVVPDLEEVKQVVFSISAESALGPDGIGALFYQTCWQIVQNDVYDFVVAFFEGAAIPRFFSHTCLVMIQKPYSHNT